MKTTLELPDALLRELKIRAVNEGKKLKDLVAEVLRRGLDSASGSLASPRDSRISVDKRTGMPVILCSRPARAELEASPQRVADLLAKQDLERHLEADR